MLIRNRLAPCSVCSRSTHFEANISPMRIPLISANLSAFEVDAEMFDFPETAFQMRWQYSELLKKYSNILSGITGSLQSVLTMIKAQGRK